MSHSQSRMLQTKLINIVWQTILLRDLDILRCSKGNVSLADCRNAVLLFSRLNDVLTQVHLFQQKKRCWDRQGGTWQAQLQPHVPLPRPRDPCAGYHSPYKAEPLHPNSPALERPSYPPRITFAAAACEELYYLPSLQRISREIAFSPYLAPAHSTIQILQDVPCKTAPR